MRSITLKLIGICFVISALAAAPANAGPIHQYQLEIAWTEATNNAVQGTGATLTIAVDNGNADTANQVYYLTDVVSIQVDTSTHAGTFAQTFTYPGNLSGTDQPFIGTDAASAPSIRAGFVSAFAIYGSQRPGIYFDINYLQHETCGPILSACGPFDTIALILATDVSGSQARLILTAPAAVPADTPPLPAPEPSTLLLLVAGGPILAWGRRRLFALK